MLSRANDRKLLFPQTDDYVRFLSLMRRTAERVSIDLFAYCLMPTHFHFVIRVDHGNDLSAYMRLLLNAHVRQHHRRHGTVGRGHIYQGRFKNFVIENSRYLRNVMRYVEGNALRAGLVAQAEEWAWGSLSPLATHPERPSLFDRRMPSDPAWVEVVNSAMSTDALDQLRTSVRRGRPYGDSQWRDLLCDRRQLHHTVNSANRPRKHAKIAGQEA